MTATLSAVLTEMRSNAPATADVPDDVLAKLLHRYGMQWWTWYGGYQRLSEARGLPLLTVLQAAADDRLADVLGR